jgi:hypothetical protein
MQEFASTPAAEKHHRVCSWLVLTQLVQDTISMCCYCEAFVAIATRLEMVLHIIMKVLHDESCF